MLSSPTKVAKKIGDSDTKHVSSKHLATSLMITRTIQTIMIMMSIRLGKPVINSMIALKILVTIFKIAPQPEAEEELILEFPKTLPPEADSVVKI